MTSPVLQRLWASSGDEIIYDTLEITDGVSTYYLVKGMEEELVLGGKVYRGYGIDVALPEKTASGVQDLTFAIDNTSGEIGHMLREAQNAGRKIEVTFREYVSSSPDEVSYGPVRMQVKSCRINNGVANITASVYNFLNTAMLREYYDLNKFWGLKFT